MTNSFDVGPSVSINDKLSLEDREQVRQRLESWILEQLTDKESEVLTEIGGVLYESGYTEEYGTHETSLNFHLQTPEELQFRNSASNNFDDALHEEAWVTEEKIKELENRLEKACERTTSHYHSNLL